MVFATEQAARSPAADPLLLTGVIFGQLGAEPEPRAFYREIEQGPGIGAPVAWARIDPPTYDALSWPAATRPACASTSAARRSRRRCWRSGRRAAPWRAICHGVLVLARTRDPATGASVLADRRTTCLPEVHGAHRLLSTAWKLGRYYRTYPAYVEDEVKAALGDPGGSS